MLPGGVTVARLALDQLVEVRILAGQPFLSSIDQCAPREYPVAEGRRAKPPPWTSIARAPPSRARGGGFFVSDEPFRSALRLTETEHGPPPTLAGARHEDSD